MSQYASNQPEGFVNSIERIAVVGASGNVGSAIVAALLKSGKHTITALPRKESTSKLPDGIHVSPVDFNDEASLVAALHGQQFLIISLAPMAGPDADSKIVQAAAKAGVPYIMPNAYGGDVIPAKRDEDLALGPIAKMQRDEIERLGMQWVCVCCGFWYDYSLARGPARYGFDLERRAVTLYDDGNTKISTTTLPQVGRAVAAVAGLKLLPQDAGDKAPTFSAWLGRAIYVKSFVVSQNDMLASVKRVTGTTDADWTVTKEDVRVRFAEGKAQVQKGDMSGYAKMLYARAFYPEDATDISAKAENELLGLPVENLDDETRAAIEQASAIDQNSVRNRS